MLDVSFPIAFGAGLLSFFAPCAIPLFPAYLAYISGDSFRNTKSEGVPRFKKKVLVSGLVYTLGFSLTFMLLGSSFAGIGIALRRNEELIRIISGLIIILFGLEFSGIVRIPLFSRGGLVSIPPWSGKLGVLRPFIVGVAFATTWAPCVGPVLGSILALSLIRQTVFEGSLLLFTYSLGISIPFLAASFVLSVAHKRLTVTGQGLETISRISGYFMILLGILVATGKLGYVNTFFTNLF